MLSKFDLAKYPFTVEAVEYVRKLGLDLTDVASQDLNEVLNRAEGRILEALDKQRISREWESDEIEIVSYPAALMLLSLADLGKAKWRYALAEAKRAYELLRIEASEKILNIAKATFGWKTTVMNAQFEKSFFEFGVHYGDFLRNSTHIREPKWKLVNRILSGGYVYVTKDEFARLLKEEIERKVQAKIAESQTTTVPALLSERVAKLRETVGSKFRDMTIEESPRAVLASAMPPCIRHLFDLLHAGSHIPHIGRFTFTSFLLRAGASEEEVVKTLRELTDFNERITRYQVEHIAGKRGSQIHYTPPKCSTLKTHGVCYNPDEVCSTISHPLSYYRKKLKIILEEGDRTMKQTSHHKTAHKGNSFITV